jgi:hypothetical protein
MAVKIGAQRVKQMVEEFQNNSSADKPDEQ